MDPVDLLLALGLQEQPPDPDAVDRVTGRVAEAMEAERRGEPATALSTAFEPADAPAMVPRSAGGAALAGPRPGPVARRRTLLRTAAAAVAAGPIVGAAAGRAAAASVQHAVTTLYLDDQFVGSKVSINLVHSAIVDHFLPSHPGVRVNVAPMSFFGAADGGVSAILAGQGPDVFYGASSDLGVYTSAGVITPLTDLLKRDNIDPEKLFSATQLAAQRFGPQQMALPSYGGPMVLVVDEGKLDDLGLAYPEPGWTYQDAEKLWAAASGRDPRVPGGWRYGMVPEWYIGPLWSGGWGGSWLPHGWGGDFRNATQTKALFNTAPVVESVSWLLSLFTRKIALPRIWGKNWYGGLGSVIAGRAVMGVAGEWTIGGAATGMRGRKWNYYPNPTYPAGPATLLNDDFCALSAGSKHPELAWELYKFMTMDPRPQMLAMHTNLVGPALVDLWPVWEGTVRAIVPELRTKSLHYYREAMAFGYPHEYFRYEPIQANTMIGSAVTKLPPNGKSDVRAVFQQLTRQLDALEANAVQYASETSAAVAMVDRSLARGQPLPAPHLTGVGVGPGPAPKGALETVRAGVYVLTGNGADVGTLSSGLPSANCVFAGSQATAGHGEYVCRVVSLQPFGTATLSPWAKVGLMVAGDLSDSAASLAFEVTGGNGVWFQTQPIAGNGWFLEGPGAIAPRGGVVGVSAGLLQASAVTAPSSSASANRLLRPIWLRLVRDGLSWTPYTSVDGRTWTQAAAPSAIEVGGVWVGLFATAHNGAPNGAGRVRATFDHASFPVSSAYQVGRP